MAEIREPPRTLEEFEKLSWSQKRQLKENFPDTYWFFIACIRKRDENESI